MHWNRSSNLVLRKFKLLHETGLDPARVLEDYTLLPFEGKRGKYFRSEIAEMTDETRSAVRMRAERQIQRARELDGSILTYRHPCYPTNVFRSNHPVPVLYTRGNREVLRSESVVACVGSRRIRLPYSQTHAVLASGAARAGIAIGSGFALGADTIGHRAAFDAGGYTICVLPGGLDRPFPPENGDLWKQLLVYPESSDGERVRIRHWCVQTYASEAEQTYSGLFESGVRQSIGTERRSDECVSICPGTE